MHKTQQYFTKKALKTVAFFHWVIFISFDCNSQTVSSTDNYSETSQESFEELISETNEYLAQYSKLYMDPHSIVLKGIYKMDDFEFTEEEMNMLLQYVEEYGIEYGIEYLSEHKDSIEHRPLARYFQTKIVANLKKIIAHDKFEDHNIESLLKTSEHSDSDLEVTISEDRKLYNFSLPQKTGGSYRSKISVMHYTEIKQEVPITQEEIAQMVEQTIIRDPSREIKNKNNPYEIFKYSDGYNGIYSIKTNEGTKYVLTEFIWGCTLCFTTGVLLVTLEDGIFKKEFAYSVTSRSWEDGVCYNPETQTIVADYITNLYSPDCHCNHHPLPEKESDDTKEKPEKKCRCTFEFNGSTFALTQSSQEEMKKITIY